MYQLNRALAHTVAAAAAGLMGASAASADPNQPVLAATAKPRSTAQAPAPLGVFGADMPAHGKFVVSILSSVTRLHDNHVGTARVSAADIVSTVTSPATPVGPHLLRLVPTSSMIETEGFAVAYGVSGSISLFASSYMVQKDVDIRAYQGLAGATVLGSSVGSTSGIGDTTVAVIGRLHQDATNRLNVNLGLTLPTGSTTRTMSVLVPDGTRPARRAFYAMQPGSGTVDLLPGVTYSGIADAWSWGASYRARLPLDRNAQGWAYGDLHEINVWSGYSWLPGFETTFRINASVQGCIRGQDAAIRGYAQGSDPQFYGGRQIGAFAGALVAGRFVGVPAAQLGLEVGAPFYQDLNGPQLARDWQLSGTVRYRF
jgi:hypothetical protein